MHDERPRRRQQRVPLGGSVRLLIDTPDGLVTATRHIVNLSEGGCAIRVHRPIDSNLAGRVNVEVAGGR